MNFNMKEMLEAGVHFGHQTRRWNPKMSPYIFGERNGIHIIDLQKTVRMAKRAFDYLEEVTAQGGHVLFVGTKRLARDIVAEEARRSGQHFINYRWLGGTMTNFPTIRQSIHRLKRLERIQTDGTLKQLTKKEALGISREVEKLELNLGGVKDMPGTPSALFVVDAHKEQIAVKEAARLGIEVIAITDTNADPDGIKYLIPGNDDSLKAIQLFCRAAADACAAGKARSKNASPDDDNAAPVSEGSFRDTSGKRVNVEVRKTEEES
jgi:small subunit ribosomal protein S2